MNDQLFCGKDRLSVPPIVFHAAKDLHILPQFQLTEGGIIVALWLNSSYYLDRVSKVWKRIAWKREEQYNQIAGKQADGSMIIVARR